jgi:hypothetical protein
MSYVAEAGARCCKVCYKLFLGFFDDIYALFKTMQHTCF